MRSPVLLLPFVICIFAVLDISANTLVVTKIEDTNDGLCDLDCSLREAVSTAAANDTVVFSSLFNTPQLITLGLGAITITRSVTIVGPGPDLLEIRGNGSSQIFGISQAAAVAMSGLMLTHGYALESGGAIWAAGPSLDLTNMVIAHNAAVFPSNFPAQGGGITSYGILTITNSTIWDNVATSFPPYQVGFGGGMRIYGVAYILNCSIINNQSLIGGGIYGGQIYLTNSTISGNGARDGAGVYNNGTLTLTNSTIANNIGLSGGGIYNAGTVVARNSIIAGNGPVWTVSDFWGPVVSEGNNLIGNTDGSSGWIASDLQNVDPRLGPLGYNGGSTVNHPIAPNSPAKNAGNNALARDPFNNSMLIYDQRGAGFDRIVGSTVDIGPFEANWSTVPVTVGGRVTTLFGRGIPTVRLTLTDGANVYYTQTNPFGYYRFANIIPGVYTISVTHKYYDRFNAPPAITVDQNRNDLNFMQLN